MEIDYTKLKPYVITLTRNTKSEVNYSKMIASGVSGVIVEGGYLYDSLHREVDNFRNPFAYRQADAALKYDLPIGWLMYGRAKTVKEAQKEIYQFSFPIRKYSPGIGVWIKLEMNVAKATMDAILDIYKVELERLGLSGKIGIKCSTSQLKQLTWSEKQHDWNLWLIEPVKNVSQLNTLLSPEFFDVGGKYV